MDAIDDKIILLSRQMVATLRYFSLIGFFSKAFMSRGLAASQVGVAKRLIVCSTMLTTESLLKDNVSVKNA